MAEEITLTKELAGLEDVLVGTGTVNQTRNGVSLPITRLNVKNLSSGSLETDSSAVASETRLLLYDVDTGALVRVSVGANDSGGTGFKVLRIPN